MFLYSLTFPVTTASEMRSFLVGIMVEQPLAQGMTFEGHSISTPANVAALKEWAAAGTVRGTVDMHREECHVTMAFERFETTDFEHSQVRYAFTCIHFERAQP